jgi:hypothetical protein
MFKFTIINDRILMNYFFKLFRIFFIKLYLFILFYDIQFSFIKAAIKTVDMSALLFIFILLKLIYHPN